MQFKGLNFTAEQDIIQIELNTADNRNTLSASLLDELIAALELARQEKQGKILLLTGSGRTFSIGADVAEMDALQPQDVGGFVDRGQAVVRALVQLEIPTIAAVNGLAFGGGLELALGCDMIWAHKRALFSLPECRLGLIPVWGGLQLLPLHVSSSTQLELLLSGDRFNAQAAQQMGLVGHIFEGRDFLPLVVEEAQKFVDKDREVLTVIKKLTRGVPALEPGFAESKQAFQQLWENRRGQAGD